MKISVRRTDSEGRGENNNASEQVERDREDNLDAIGRWFDHFLATLLKDLDYIGIARILKKYSQFSHLNPRRWNSHLFTKISLWVFFSFTGQWFQSLHKPIANDCLRTLGEHYRSGYESRQTWNFHQLILVLLPDFPLEIWLKSTPVIWPCRGDDAWHGQHQWYVRTRRPIDASLRKYSVPEISLPTYSS